MKRFPNISRFLVVTPAILMGLAVASCDGRSALIVGTGAEQPSSVELQAAAQDDAQLILVSPSGSATTADPAVLEVPVLSLPDNTQSQELLAAMAAEGNIRVMSMGDSITQGVGGAKSYRYELKQLIADSECPMKLVGTQSAASPDVGFYSPHEGYSGHAADYFLTGNHGSNEGVAAAVDHQKPDVVLLHVGSVDIFLGHDVASTLAEIDQMISVIHNTKPDTLVFIANVIPWVSVVDGADRPGLIKSLGDQIEMYVSESENPQLYLVDVRSGFSVDLLQDDLIHPNEAGDAHIADAFFNQLYSSNYCK